MQPFPMMPHLETQTRRAFRGAEEQSGLFRTHHGDDGATDAEQPPTSDAYVVGRRCFTPGGPKGIK